MLVLNLFCVLYNICTYIHILLCIGFIERVDFVREPLHHRVHQSAGNGRGQNNESQQQSMFLHHNYVHCTM